MVLKMVDIPSELGKICFLPCRCVWLIQKTLTQVDTEDWYFHIAGGMDAIQGETRGSSCSAAYICLCVRALSSVGGYDWPSREGGLKARDLPAPACPIFPALCYRLCNSIKTSRFYLYILNVFCLLRFKVLFSDFKAFSSLYINFYLPQS